MSCNALELESCFVVAPHHAKSSSTDGGDSFFGNMRLNCLKTSSKSNHISSLKSEASCAEWPLVTAFTLVLWSYSLWGNRSRSVPSISQQDFVMSSKGCPSTSVDSDTFHNLAIDVLVKHVPVLLHMTFAVSWVPGPWQVVVMFDDRRVYSCFLLGNIPKFDGWYDSLVVSICIFPAFVHSHSKFFDA